MARSTSKLLSTSTLALLLACRGGGETPDTTELGASEDIDDDTDESSEDSDGSSMGSSDSGSESVEDESSSDDSGDGVKFDSLVIPDSGDGPVLPTIPETCEQALMIESTVGCSFHRSEE